MVQFQVEGPDDKITKDHIMTILWFSVSVHSKHQDVMVDYSMAQLISVEYEQDCCHSVLSEMQISDNKVSWLVEY